MSPSTTQIEFDRTDQLGTSSAVLKAKYRDASGSKETSSDSCSPASRGRKRLSNRTAELQVSSLSNSVAYLMSYDAARP